MVCVCVCVCVCSAPINVMPHLPHPGDMWGRVGYGSRLFHTSGRAMSQTLVKYMYSVIQAAMKFILQFLE